MEVEYSIKPTRWGDVFLMASRMREADCQEIWASHMNRPLEGLLKAVKNSDVCRTGRANGEIACMFGVAAHTMVSDRASIWMLGTDLLNAHSIRFLRECHKGIIDISKGLIFLENWCDARNKLTLRWLQWLGFTIEEAEPYGVYEMPFHHFYKKVL